MDCPICKGSPKDFTLLVNGEHTHYNSCLNCNNTGRIKMNHADIQKRLIDCPECGGSGRKHVIFLDSNNTPLMIDKESNWLYYWHPDKRWVTYRELKASDWFPANLTLDEQKHYDVASGFDGGCPTCKGSKKIIEDELIPIEVPEGYKFDEIIPLFVYVYAIFKHPILGFIHEELPYKTGLSTLTCETCGGRKTVDSGKVDDEISSFSFGEPIYIVCPQCHGKPVIKIDTKISVIEQDGKYLFECKWEVLK